MRDRPVRRTPALLAAAAAAALLAVACRPAGVPGARPARTSFPATWRFAAGQRAEFATNAMVASNSRLASDAGVEVMRRGGNAVDAAVAVGFALAVTFPQAGNLGGGGYMVIQLADGRTAALDYREIAPLAATRDMYLDSTGALTDRSVVGPLASGVPGAVAGMAEALRRYGTMTLAQAMAPAIRLAAEGFVVDSSLHRSLESSRALLTRFDGRDVYYPGGQTLAVGARFAQPALARTLRLIAERGSDAFYRGEVGDSLVAELTRGGGIITKADLAGYKPLWREPLRTGYRGHTLITMPPSSSGGVTITETLNILETDPKMPPFGSTAYAHLLGSAYQRAFIDRNNKIGDPAFVRVPLDTLTSKAYARQLRASIDPARATPTAQLSARQLSEGMHTTHYSVVDAKGNAVSTTTTLNNTFGSGVYLRSVGFLLNDEMDDFAAQPGKPNMFGLVQGEQNAIQPGKRMLSAMSPTIVLDSAGRVLLVAGAAGGPTIITGTSQVILNVVDQHMSLADAMRAPRLHHQALPDTIRYEEGGFAPAVLDSLRAMGHALQPVPRLVNVNAIMRVRRGWEGVSEPRAWGNGAVGY